MSLTVEAIRHIEAQALAAAAHPITVDGGVELVVLPATVTLHNLEQFKPVRDRFRGAFKTHALSDFTKYAATQAEDFTRGFINQDAMSATVIFDLGNADLAGHGEHTATLSLKPTAAYSAVQGIAGQTLTQQQLAEWLEDWAPHLQALAHGENLGIVQAITGIRKMTIKATSQRDSNVGDLNTSRSSMDDIEARSLETLPTEFLFSVVPFEGLQPAVIQLRLSVITGKEAPLLKLRWVGEEAQRETFAREFKGVLEKEVGGLVPLTIGAFTLGK